MVKFKAFFLALALTLGAASPALSETLKIGILPVLDTLPLQAAVDQGYFKEQGLEVELVSFASALERDTAMQSQQLDGYFGDILNTILLIKGGVPMRVVTVSYSTVPGQRMFALVQAPGADPPKPGDSLKTGVSKATVIEYLLSAMALQPEVKGLSFPMTEIKKMPIRLQMLLAGQLDAALLPEPLVSLAESKGGGVLVTDENLRMPLTVVCLHQDKLDKAQDFLCAYARAVTALNERGEDFRALMGRTCRIPKPLTEKFPVYRYPMPRQPRKAELEPVAEWMLEKKMIHDPVKVEELLYQK